jgi:hypothetical protein
MATLVFRFGAGSKISLANLVELPNFFFETQFGQKRFDTLGGFGNCRGQYPCLGWFVYKNFLVDCLSFFNSPTRTRLPVPSS